MQPQARAGDQAELPARPAEELAEVEARHVLDDLAAGARDGPVSEHDGDAEDEIARSPVPVPPRAGEVAGDAGADRRIAGRIERKHLAVLGEPHVQVL